MCYHKTFRIFLKKPLIHFFPKNQHIVANKNQNKLYFHDYQFVFYKNQISIKPWMPMRHEMLISILSGFTFSELFPVPITLEPPISF